MAIPQEVYIGGEGIVWCSICGKYHDTTSAAGGCIAINPVVPKPPRIIVCPHCGKEIIIEVRG